MELRTAKELIGYSAMIITVGILFFMVDIASNLSM